MTTVACQICILLSYLHGCNGYSINILISSTHSTDYFHSNQVPCKFDVSSQKKFLVSTNTCLHLITVSESSALNTSTFVLLRLSVDCRWITWLSACLEVKVTMGICPWSSFLGSLSMQALALCSDPTVITQKPFDCPLARFSWKRTSSRSPTPMLPIAFSTSASVVHWARKWSTFYFSHLNCTFRKEND